MSMPARHHAEDRFTVQDVDHQSSPDALITDGTIGKLSLYNQASCATY